MHGFGGKEIAAHPVSRHPDTARRHEMPDMLEAAMPEGAAPAMRTDMGWRHRRAAFTGRLGDTGAAQGMSRKGDRIDNDAAEQVFGHLRDGFLRDRDRGAFEGFKADLEAHIRHWNHAMRQVRPKGPTPAGSRDQALRGAA